MSSNHGGHYSRLGACSTKEMSEMYECGESTEIISQISGLGVGIVNSRLKKVGVKIRSCKEARMLAKKLGRIPYGERHPRWKGGCITRGYKVLVIEGVPIREHRAVWEKMIGPIPKGYVIHHLNGIKDDNRIDNLFCVSRSEHNPISMLKPYRDRILFLEKQLSEMGGN